jgi:hypothetical protein
MTRYADDPRWARAHYPDNYSSCGAPIARAERIFYWPPRGAVSCVGPAPGEMLRATPGPPGGNAPAPDFPGRRVAGRC